MKRKLTLALVLILVLIGIFATVNAQEAANLPLTQLNSTESRFYLDDSGNFVFFAKSWDSEFWFYLNNGAVRMVDAPDMGEESLVWNGTDSGAGFVSDGSRIIWMGDHEPNNYHRLSRTVTEGSLYSIVVNDQLWVGHDFTTMVLVADSSQNEDSQIVDAAWVLSAHYRFGSDYVNEESLVIVYSDGNVIYWNLPQIPE